MDPGLQIDIITELDLVNMTIGVTQVSGLHNASKAFLFQGKAVTYLHFNRNEQMTHNLDYMKIWGVPFHWKLII